MVSRSVLALFAIAVIVASVNAAPAVEEVDVDVDTLEILSEVERGSVSKWFKKQAKKIALKGLKEAIGYAQDKAAHVKWGCVKKIYKTCKEINPILHPKKYYKCAKKYVLSREDRCYDSEKVTEPKGEENVPEPDDEIAEQHAGDENNSVPDDETVEA